MPSPRLTRSHGDTDDASDVCGARDVVRAERSVLDWVRGGNKQLCSGQTQTDLRMEHPATTEGKRETRRSQLCARVQSPSFGAGHAAPARCLSGATAMSADHVRPAKQVCTGQSKTPARPSPLRGEGVERQVKNKKHIQLGGRLLSRMLASLLKHKALQDAVEFGPNIRLGGEANFLFRSKLRFARKMLRAWLWVQSLERLSALPTPKKTAKGPRVRPQTKPEAGPFAPQGLSVLRRDLPQQDDLSRRLRAQGFRPRVGIWRQKSSICSCAAPSLRPLCGAHCARAVLVGKDNRDRMCSGQPQTDLRMEHPATTEGKRETRRPLGRLARVSASPSRLRQNKLTHSNAPRAGQIYVDLRYMQALVTMPDRAIARLARRIRAKKTIFSFKDKRPLAEPKPPSQNWRNRLTLPPSQEEWWRGLAAPPPHPQPEAPP